MSQLERDIEDRVVRWAVARGFLTPKVKFVENGWPDRLFISPYGHTVFIEFKRPGLQPEKLQTYRIEALRKRNIPAFWVDSYDKAVAILENCLGTEIIPEKSNSTSSFSSSSGTVSGSWFGEDIDGPSYYKDTSESQPYKESIDHSSPPSSTEGVAGRDREMGGLPPPTLDGSPWDPEKS